MVQTINQTSLVGNEKGTAVKPFPSRPSGRQRKWVRRSLKISLFLAPALIIYSMFMAIPLVFSMRLSFYSTTGVGIAKFVGLSNYAALFTNSDISKHFVNALTNNFKFFAITMVTQNLLALFVAVMLNRGLRFFSVIRTVLFIPATMSIVLVGYIWTLLLNPNWGVVNKMLSGAGLKSWAIPWLGNEHTALTAVAIVNSWQFIGLAIMLFLAGLQNIPDDLFEAAGLDGAGAWSKFIHITVPQLVPVFGIVTILTLVGNFSQFELIYAMEGTMAGPNYSTDVLGTLFYRTSFSSINGSLPNLGLGASISTVTFAIVFCLVCIQLYLTQWRKAK